MSGPNSTVYKRDVALINKWLPTFRRSMLFHFTGSICPRRVSYCSWNVDREDGDSKVLRNLGQNLPVETM
jgi:hypothetical protein